MIYGREIRIFVLSLIGIILFICSYPVHAERSIDWRDGELWIVDDARDLPAYVLEILEGKATLVVFGELTLDPEIEPAILTEKLAKVHNLGMIWCTRSQAKALRERLGLHDGVFQDSARLAEPEEDTDGLGYPV